MSDETRAIAIRVEGRVQGVGYRAFAREAAQRHAVRGWVVNREDGSVEGALEGPGAALADLIKDLRSGPPGAKVETLEVVSTDRAKIVEVPAQAYPFG